MCGRRGDADRRPGNAAARGNFAYDWDLGEEWNRWTGLPFVFALWVARPGVELAAAGECLAAARDEGITLLPEIARQAAPIVEIPEAECLAYLRDHLEFRLGVRQRLGLERFFDLAARNGLA